MPAKSTPNSAASDWTSSGRPRSTAWAYWRSVILRAAPITRGSSASGRTIRL